MMIGILQILQFNFYKLVCYKLQKSDSSIYLLSFFVSFLLCFKNLSITFIIILVYKYYVGKISK